jgi:hypothetical protein
MKYLKHIAFYSFLVLVATSMNSCKKIEGFSAKHLSFSTDSLVFDTIFTTIGSTTKQFKFYNNESKELQIESIDLMGGSSSPFRINIDGSPGIHFEDIVMLKKDSLFAFVEVTLNVNSQNFPMVIEDSIRFVTNGKSQYIHLAVWGQNVHYHYSKFSDSVFDLNEGTWPNDKPHLIYGAAVIDSGKTLNIPAGTQIFLHKNSFLFNYKGTLNINGTKDNEVVIQGDRLEAMYQNVQGQYYGVYMDHAQSSTFNYTIIKNGTAGIHLTGNDPANTDYTLKLNNSIIHNNASYGIWLYSGARLKAENSIVSGNGIHALFVLEGADFDIRNCNLLGYQSNGESPAVGISNYYESSSTIQVGNIDGKIYNSVIYGLLDQELVYNIYETSGITISIDIQRCLIKGDSALNSDYYTNFNQWNLNPLFTNTVTMDFTFQSASPLNNTGDPILSTPMDIHGNTRNFTPDIGAIESL